MKKFGAILLTFMMVISIITVPASAEGEVITFDALTDATEYFYDNGGTSIYNLVGDLKLAAGEMASYDISDLEGTYEVSISYIQNQGNGTWHSFIEFSVDNEWQLSSKHLHTEGVAWGGTAVDSGALGNVYIDADSKYLKLKNSGRFNLGIDQIKLTPVETAEKAPVTLYTENITNTAESGVVTKGTDYNDAVAFPASGSNVISPTGFVIMQPNDWFRYDVSGLKAGYYKLSMNSYNYSTKGDATVHFELDGASIASVLFPTKTTTAAVSEIGTVEIPENAKYLKVYATMSDTQSVRANEIYFTPVDIETDGLELNASASVTKTNGTVTEGTDYHDEAGVAYGTAVQSIRNFSGVNHLALHNGDWTRYDISGMPSGTYDVSLQGTTAYLSGVVTATVSILLDDKVAVSKVINKTSTFDEKAIGKVYIPNGTQYLKLKIETSVTQAVYIEYLKFTQLAEGVYIDAVNDIKESSTVQYFDSAKTAIKLDANSTWASYDASALSAGEYNVYATYRTTAKINVNLTSAETKAVTLENTGGAFEELFVGTAKLTEDNKTVKIEFTNATANVCLRSLKVEPMSGADVNVSYEAYAKGGTQIETIKDLVKAYAVIDLGDENVQTLGAKIYVAVYDGDRLKSVTNADTNDVIILSGLDENTTIKTFIWKDGSLLPIAEEESISPL